MSRRRNISTDISTDPRIAELAAHGALPVLLYTWAIPHADDWGRLTGDARQFRLLVCPGFEITAKEVDEALTQIAEAGLWLRYTVEERAYIAFPPTSWFKYQNYVGHDKRKTDGSQIPAPADRAYRITPQNPEQRGESNDSGVFRRKTPQNPEDHRGSPQNTASPSPSPSPTPSPSPSPTFSEGEVVSDAAANARAREGNESAPPPATLAVASPVHLTADQELQREVDDTLARWKTLSQQGRARVPSVAALRSMLRKHAERGMNVSDLRTELLKLEDEVASASAGGRPLTLTRADNWLNQWHAPPPDTRPAPTRRSASAARPEPPSMIRASQAADFWNVPTPLTTADATADAAEPAPAVASAASADVLALVRNQVKPQAPPGACAGVVVGARAGNASA